MNMNPENKQEIASQRRKPVFRTRISRAKEATKTFFVFAATQIFFAALILSFSFGGEAVFGLLIAIPPIILIMLGRKDSYLLLLYFACISFAVGQRTIYIGSDLRFVPGDIIMIGLGIVCLFLKPKHLYKKNPIPLALLIMSLLIIFYIRYTGAKGEVNFTSINRSFAYSKMMWMSIPCFFVLWQLITRVDQVRTIFTIFVMESFFLSFLALSDYFNFGYVKYFGNFLKHTDMITSEGFRRMGAAFWGGPSLAAFIAMLYPLQISQLFVSRTLTQKVIITCSSFLSLLVIYYSGHRGMWIALIAGIIIYFVSKGAKGLVMLMLIVGIGAMCIPEQGMERIKSLHGKSQDSSAKVREGRAREAWALIKANPLGNGWGASGLVHSDILQLTADTGIFSGGAYLLLYIQIFVRLFKKRKRIFDKTLREYNYALTASILIMFIMLWTQAFFNLPEQYILVWFLTALAYQYPNIVLTEKIISKNTNIPVTE